jgi:pimeloyl-ACP methyl ester carboxylesterase
VSKILSYFSKGSGPCIVLLHGFCENKALWYNFAEQLSESFHVVVPDLPGFGDSSLEEDMSMENMAIKVNELLEHLKIDSCVMIGHSMGGYVTLAYTEKYPYKLHGISLFHSTSFADSQEKKESRNKTNDFIKKHGMDAFADSFVTPLFYVKNRDSIKDKIAMATDMVRSTSAYSAIEASKGMRDRKERTDTLTSFKKPVMFIAGKEDQAIPLEKTLAECYLPANSVTHFLGNTAHMGMFEKSKETFLIVKSFIDYSLSF